MVTFLCKNYNSQIVTIKEATKNYNSYNHPSCDITFLTSLFVFLHSLDLWLGYSTEDSTITYGNSVAHFKLLLIR
jgi:hypothetical protein